MFENINITQKLLTILSTQFAIACFLNGLFTVRLPYNLKDFLKLSFLPYIIYCLLFDRDSVIT